MTTGLFWPAPRNKVYAHQIPHPFLSTSGTSRILQSPYRTGPRLLTGAQRPHGRAIHLATHPGARRGFAFCHAEGLCVFEERGALAEYPLHNAEDPIDAPPAPGIPNHLSIESHRWRGGYRQGHRSWRPTWRERRFVVREWTGLLSLAALDRQRLRPQPRKRSRRRRQPGHGP